MIHAGLPETMAASTPSSPPPDYETFTIPPRILVIGAGSRGCTYAAITTQYSNAVIAAVCEPVAYKRSEFGRRFIWGEGGAAGVGQAFGDWREWVEYEVGRRGRQGEGGGGEEGERGVDAVFVCVLDELHEEVVVGMAGLGVHVCCEKPMSTRLESCVKMYKALGGAGGTRESTGKKEAVFGICHVLRYSPHNVLLRHLVRGEKVIGDVLSMEHVEPIGWWHFSHSYVRGNWRKESKTAPSLLTKSCHDMDFLLWMLCSPPPEAEHAPPHLPSYVASTGSRKFFRKDRKPQAAGRATNCLDCAHEQDCEYSARKIYLDRFLLSGHTGWPVKVVNPEVEDMYTTQGQTAAAKALLKNLGEDYTEEAAADEIEARPWFGRCVWEADNDVCDDQYVTIDWEDDPIDHDSHGRPMLDGRAAKTAQFHMVAFTEKMCDRRGRIYGTQGEIEYDSTSITVHSFATGQTTTHHPQVAGIGHGGGDEGLVRQFLRAVNAVDSGAMSAADAQRRFLGCDLDEAFRSHALVFVAEAARNERRVVDWRKWWSANVAGQLEAKAGG